MADFSLFTLSLLMGWVLDLIFGDPQRLPHPIVWFGKMISFGEHRLNKNLHRKLKGAVMSIVFIVGVFVVTWLARRIMGTVLRDTISNGNWIIRTVPVIFAEFTLFF